MRSSGPRVLARIMDVARENDTGDAAQACRANSASFGGLAEDGLIDAEEALVSRTWRARREELRDAPGLSDAAAGCERRLRVEDLADRADTCLIEVWLEAGEEVARLRCAGRDAP